jgi:hypothetical protein
LPPTTATNATTAAAATNYTAPITINGTTYNTNNTDTITLSSMHLAAQYPDFTQFSDILDGCGPNASPARNGTMPHYPCVEMMQQEVYRWCTIGLPTFHTQKCETSSTELGTYTTMYEITGILESP